MISFNLPDPTEQEKIRRGPHKYVAEQGVHGRYVPVIGDRPVDPKREKGMYIHQEYPKVMDKSPYPQLKDYKGKQDPEILLEHDRKRWDERQMQSIVHNKSEEEAYLAEHANDTVLTPGAYPKTMDRTPAPRSVDCDGLDDYREKRRAWREQIQASIVHDEAEEELWLEEHEAVEAPKRRGKAKAA